jgi:hypothetical protein
MQSYLVGGRILASWNGRPGDRVLGALLKLSVGFSLDVVKTNLEEFTWSGRAPDDTWSFLGSLGASGAF